MTICINIQNDFVGLFVVEMAIFTLQDRCKSYCNKWCTLDICYDILCERRLHNSLHKSNPYPTTKNAQPPDITVFNSRCVYLFASEQLLNHCALLVNILISILPCKKNSPVQFPFAFNVSYTHEMQCTQK